MAHDMQAVTAVRVSRYYVHVSGEARHTCEPVHAEGFEAAAVLYAESQADAAGELRLIVVDAATNEQQCFTLDLDAGEAEPCH